MTFVELPREPLQAQRASAFLPLSSYRSSDHYDVRNVEVSHNVDDARFLVAVEIPPVELSTDSQQSPQGVSISLAWDRVSNGRT